MAESNDKNKPHEGMTRRNFVISLGAGVTTVIAGYFLAAKAFSPSQPREGKNDGPVRPVRPQLRSDVVFGSREGMVTISRPRDNDSVLCAVNPPGAEILRRLDGKHTIEDIGSALALRLKNCKKEEVNAKVAGFVAQTAEWGFLSEPFYACLYETYTT